MPECCFVSACSSFSLHSLLCISPFSLPFLFLTLESYSLVPFLLACFVLSRCATRGHRQITPAACLGRVLGAEPQVRCRDHRLSQLVIQLRVARLFPNHTGPFPCHVALQQRHSVGSE